MKKMFVFMGILAMTAAQTTLAMEHNHQHMQDEAEQHADHGSMDMTGDMTSEDEMKGMSGHEHMMHETSEADSKDEPYMVTKEVDGFTVTFHVMLAGGMYHGGDYNLMIKVEQDGKDADLSAINSKVFFPDGTSDSKMLMKMGGWYMNGYDLQGEERHGLMVLFKTADGEKHKASAYYPKP